MSPAERVGFELGSRRHSTFSPPAYVKRESDTRLATTYSASSSRPKIDGDAPQRRFNHSVAITGTTP